jgi:hypothetical protein
MGEDLEILSIIRLKSDALCGVGKVPLCKRGI